MLYDSAGSASHKVYISVEEGLRLTIFILVKMTVTISCVYLTVKQQNTFGLWSSISRKSDMELAIECHCLSPYY